MSVKKKNIDPSKPALTLREAPIVVIGARGFRQSAQPFIDKMVASYDPANPDAPWEYDPGECIASATNLALAVELYLKGLILYVHQVPDHTHDLLDLYYALPAPLRAELEAECEKIPMPPKEVGALRITLAWRPQGASEQAGTGQEQVQGRKLDLSLPGVLERERGAFIDWRYFFENARPDQPVTVDYPFGRLASIADVLDATAIRAARDIAEELAANRKAQEDAKARAIEPKT